MTLRFVIVAVCASVISMISSTAGAQEYPSRPLRLIIPYPPGGGADILGRLVAQQLSHALAQQVVVDNRGGANGIIGTELAARAPADGYTLLFPSSPHTVNVSMVSNLPYDTVKDFTPVSLVATTPYILVVHPSLPVRSVKELISFAKARPGKIDYASGGNGGSPHLAMELFKSMTGTEFVHVAYKGVGPALVDVIAGHVQVFFSNAAPAIPHIKAGRLRALATSGAKRSTVAPEIPTVAETGVKDYEASAWFGVIAPAKTPRVIVDRLNAQIVKFMVTPETRARLTSLAAEARISTPQEYGRVIEADIERWGNLVRRLGLKSS